MHRVFYCNEVCHGLQEVDGSLGASASMHLPDNITSSTSLELYLRLSCNGAQRRPCLYACNHL